MILPVIVHQITAVIDMPDEYLKQIERAAFIITQSTASTYVIVPPATLNTASKTLNTFQTAETSAERNAAFRPMVQGLQGIMGFFQAAANDDPVNAQVIVESGGFKVKTISTREKQVFKAINGAISGTVEITAEGAGSYACHDWMYSLDNENFTRLSPTMKAKKIMTGLTVGTWVYFMHQVVNKDGEQGWSQVISILVR